MTATLGNARNKAFIFTRDGRTDLAELDATSIGWGRELCAVSKGKVTVPSSLCVPDYDLIQTWANTLVVYRGDERVWEGPVRRISRSRSAGMVLDASDVLGYCDRRETGARTVTGSPVRTEMYATLVDAFDADDPNVLGYVQQLGSEGPGIDRTLTQAGAYSTAALADLVGSGGRYTTHGRRILLWVAPYTLGRTPTLVPERHMLADVEVIQDGDLLATNVYARDDQGGVGYAQLSGGAVDPTYGLVTLVTGATGSPDEFAFATLDRSYPEPTLVSVPGGATLSCDSPFPISLLVAGTLVPVETTTATGKTLSATQQLASVSVTQTGQGDRATEEVKVTVNPIGEPA